MSVYIEQIILSIYKIYAQNYIDIKIRFVQRLYYLAIVKNFNINPLIKLEKLEKNIILV